MHMARINYEKQFVGGYLDGVVVQDSMTCPVSSLQATLDRMQDGKIVVPCVGISQYRVYVKDVVPFKLK